LSRSPINGRQIFPDVRFLRRQRQMLWSSNDELPRDAIFKNNWISQKPFRFDKYDLT